MGDRHKTVWDTEFATYFWQIHLDINHEYNNTPMLTGYSKQRNQSEAQDKYYLLQRKISMLYKRNYFERMKRIDFFMKTGNVIDKNKADKILMLYPKHYDIPEEHHDLIWKTHGKWLQSFYELINSGQSIDSIIPAVRKGIINKDEFLKVENYLPTFRTVGHLYAHASRLSQHGHPPGAIEHFIKEVKRLKNW